MLPVRVRALRWVATTAACLMVAGLVSAPQGSRSRVDLVDQPTAPAGADAARPGAAEPALPAQVTPGPVEYAHDAAGRLVGATQPAGETAQYEYDEAGNLLQIERFASTEVSVLSLVPVRAPEGAEVTVTGTGFAANPADNTVVFAGVTAEVTSASATELVVAVPADAVNGPVTVTTPSGTAASREGFVVERATPQPEVSGFSPAIGAPGTSVTISGTGFDPDPDANVVRFEQTRAQVSAATTTSLTVAVPQAAGSGPVTVKTAGGMGVSAGRFVVPPPGYEAVDVGDVVTVAADGATATLDLAAGTVGLVSFTGTAGQRLGMGFESTFADPFEVGAFTPTGKPFARDQFDALAIVDGAGSLALTPLPTDGTYQVLVVPAGPVAGTVDVSLSNATTGVLDPVAGTGFTLDRPGQYAELSWSAPANQLLRMSISDWSFSSPTLLSVIVFDPHGARRADEFVTENGEFFLVTSAAGEHRVQIYSWFASTGSGTVQVVEPTDVGAVDVDGDPVGMPVSANELTALRFTATAGGWVGLGFTNWNVGSFQSLDGWVVGPDGTVLDARQGLSDGGSMNARTVASGEHRLVLSGRGTAAGSLTVIASAQLDGGALALDTPVTVGTDRPGQSIALRYTGQTGQRLAMVLDSHSFASTPRLWVVGPDGGLLTIEAQLSQLSLDPLPASGEYTFVVDAFSSVGTAQLRLEPAIDAGPITADGSSVSLTLDEPGQVGVLTFTAQSGQNLRFGFTDSTFNDADLLRVTVTKPGGLPPRDADWLVGADSAIDVEIRSNGEHKLLVGAPQGLTGEITITLSLQQDLGVLTSGSPVPITVDRPGQGLRFEVEGSPIEAATPAPRGTDAPAGEEFGRPGTGPTRPMLEPRRAPAGVTAVSGEVRTVDDRPLAGVSVSIGRRRTGTDADGHFLLVGVPAGQQRLVLDGDRVDGVSYGTYDVGVDVAPRQTTVLAEPSWLTPIDTRHTVEFESPTSEPVVLSHPDVPGLEVRIPAGTTVTDRAGKVVTELGITPIRVDRPPFPLPGFPVPVYFTVQPGGVHLSGAGGLIIYPNYTGAPAGTPADFWHYDPAGQGWYRYGNGNVSADGTRVVPDEYVRFRDLTGAMINDPAQPLPPAQAPPPGSNATGGDPVDLATGLMVEQHTDLQLDDILPIGVSRTYRQNDAGSHAFGVGTSLDEFGLRLFSVRQWEDAALILPDGGRVQFTRITPGIDTFDDAVFAAEPTPTRFQGSILAWNGNGWDLRLRDGLTYVFGDEAPLQSIRDPYGNTITITRAPGVPDTTTGVIRANGPITQITSPSGKWIRFAYDNENRITQAVDNLGRTVAYTYHETGALAGHLAAVTNPDGGTTEYGYETHQEGGVTLARLTTITDPRGITYLTNEYDTAGRVATQTQVDGTTYQFAYTEANGQVTATVVTDPRGEQQEVTFDASGYTTSDTAAVGTPEQQQLLIERDPQTHRPVATVDALGRRTETVYDANGNPSSVTRLAGTAQAQTHSYAHDGPLDQLTQVTDPLGQVTSLSYRDDGALASVTDPVGRTTTFAADPAGRLTGITDPLGNLRVVDYQAGDLVSVTDPVGRVTRLAVDVAGRVTAVTDPAGNATRYTYDPLNQTRSVTDPLGQATGLDYDPNGNLTTVTDPRGNTTSYGYDTMDRVESRTDPLGRVETYGYDPDGNLTSVDSRRGNRTEHGYDPLGRLVQARHGVTSTGQESQVAYTYDLGDRLVGVDDTTAGSLAYVFDDLDRLTQETTPAGTVTYGYDDADRRTSMTVAGQDPVTYSYNGAGDLLTILQGAQQVAHSYDGAGRLDAITLPGGWAQDYTYDPAEQLIGIAYLHNGTIAGDLVYDYHPSGQRKLDSGSWARTSLPEPFGPATYDPANQIDTVNGTTHTYDPDGNLTDDGTLAYGYNTRNQLTNLTSTAGDGASFTYDGLGRRATATIDGITRGYLYDGDNPVQELDAAGLPTANLLTGGLDVYYSRTTTTGTDTYLSDVLGSTTALGAADGTVPAEYTYQPFGAATLTGDDHGNRHQYTGRENDSTGLYHYRNRYYHPSSQRFTTEDPLGLASGDTNLYSYVTNQPTEYADPYGLKPQSRFGTSDSNHAPCSSASCGGGSTARPSLTSGTEVVQRWMSQAELDATRTTGLVRGGRGGTHYASDAASTDPLRARQRLALPQTPEVRADLEVPRGAFSRPTRVEPAYGMPGGGMERSASGSVPCRVTCVWTP